MRPSAPALGFALALLCSAPVSSRIAAAADPLDGLRRLEGSHRVLEAVSNPRTGRMTSLRLEPVDAGTPSRFASGRLAAEAFLGAHRALFGWGPSDEGRLEPAAAGRGTGGPANHFRVAHFHQGVPVRGSSATLHTKDHGVVSVLATTAGVENVSAIPSLSAADATRTAASLTSTLDPEPATLTTPTLEFLVPSLLGEPDPGAHLSWFVRARTSTRDEWIWIDAHSGEPRLHFNALPEALDRTVLDGQGMFGTPIVVRSEGEGATGDDEIDLAYEYSGDTYAYYLNAHGWESYDGNGAQMKIVVRSCLCGCPCANAFWTGDRVHIGYLPGLFLGTDDIVGHEWTHGVIDHTAGLIYFRESGALNEAYADIFGETVDLTNGRADSPGGRWKISDDLFGVSIGIRNMFDPPRQGDPGKLSDPQFHCTPDDAYGVHTNSGILNHSYALLTDGGEYNGFSITGLGLEKAADIYFHALRFYLTPSSGFFAAYHALTQACADLDGAGITPDDCAELGKVLDAVEMRRTDPCTTCPTTPPAGCATAPSGSQSLVRLHDLDDDRKDRLVWRVRSGPATTPADLADPTQTADYSLCLYAPFVETAPPALRKSATAAPAGACAQKPCWRNLRQGGVRYRDPLGASDGLKRILVRPGDEGESTIRVDAGGAALNLPPLTSVASPLTLTLTNRLNSQCWSSRFDGELRRDGTLWSANEAE